ncbi:MAG: hypothetical protein GYA30_12475, partial [Chloroflexi bacterium]|nr:hypothetical protein [Chloroflexota bacterium]
MDKSQLEPDLIQVFRLYIAFRLILVGLTSLVALVRPRVQVEPGTFFSLVELTLLLIYLSIPWFHNKLGRWFLPLALAAATLGPIVEVTLGLQRPLLARTTGTAPAADVWQVTVLLTIPLFLVAWQYSFDAVVGFTAGVAILEFSFNVARALLFGQDALLR